MASNGAWAKVTVNEFLKDNKADHGVFERLAAGAAIRNYKLTLEQRDAWIETLEILNSALIECLERDQIIGHWSLLFEYEIPRRGKRPDVVLLGNGVACVLEMKIGANKFSRSDCLQVEDYVKDLRDFHEESRSIDVIPILCASEALSKSVDLSSDEVQKVSKWSLGDVLTSISISYKDRILIDADEWERSRYKPTPGIIEAALEVYSGHDVREISYADADNLTETVAEIRRLIRLAQENSERIVCFVTGVPGSGKTLAGLSAVHLATETGENENIGIYLSGNGPLVDVLQYALAKSTKEREAITMKEATRRAETMVQMVHRFIKYEAISKKPPPENVIVFDEAQRAWDAKQMKRKQKIERSEAELTFEIMERKPNWCVVVALVGEGQEINTGEAGITEWMQALGGFPNWKIYVSPHVKHDLDDRPIVKSNLHLSVGVRAPRGRVLTDWIDAVLEGKAEFAQEALSRNRDYPVFITRDIAEMKNYLRDLSSPERRVGLLASAQARRLRSLGIEMSNEFQSGIHWPQWFIESEEDLRSSYSLEVAASEFKCQGLEIDWAGLCWGADFIYDEENQRWVSWKLSGSKWQKDKTIEKQQQAINRYRVLLSRARYGLILWIPRFPDYSAEDNDGMKRTYDFLKLCGAVALPPKEI